MIKTAGLQLESGPAEIAAHARIYGAVVALSKFTPLFEIEINFLHHGACLPSLACSVLIPGASGP